MSLEILRSTPSCPVFWSAELPEDTEEEHVNEQDCLEVTLCTYIREMLGFSLTRDIGYPDGDFSCFSLDPWGKGHDHFFPNSIKFIIKSVVLPSDAV
jgi:hypothetical protein